MVNVKLLFFSPAVSLKNIPFEGVITEADSGKIVVKGDGTNGCGLTEHYQIYNSDPVSYTHLDVYKRQVFYCEHIVIRE